MTRYKPNVIESLSLKAKQFPFLGILWGALLLLFSWLDPVVGLAIGCCSLVAAIATLAIFVLIFYLSRSSTPIPRWNFLTANLTAACFASLAVIVLVCCGASAGLLEIELMPVPN